MTPAEAQEIGRRIVDPEDGSVEELMERGPDVIEALLAHVDAEPARIAAAVAAERAAIVARLRRDAAAWWTTQGRDALRAVADALASEVTP